MNICKIVLPICVLLTALAPAANAGDMAQSGTAAGYVEAGDRYMMDSIPTAAKEAYEKAEAINPDFDGLHARLGALYTILREYDKAIDEIEKAVKLTPELEADALPQLILLCTYRSNPKVINYLQRLNEIDPKNGKQLSFQVFHARIHGLLETENGFEIGQPVLSLSDPRDNKFMAGFMQTVALFLTAGEPEKAISFHKETLLQKDLSPQVTATINHSAGMIYATKMKKPELGLEYLEKASALWPDNTEFAIHLIDTYRLLEKHQEASKSLEQLLSVDPHNKYALFFMGTTQMQLRNWRKAVEYWDKLRETDEILFGLIRKEYETGKTRSTTDGSASPDINATKQ